MMGNGNGDSIESLGAKIGKPKDGKQVSVGKVKNEKERPSEIFHGEPQVTGGDGPTYRHLETLLFKKHFITRKMILSLVR